MLIIDIIFSHPAGSSWGRVASLATASLKLIQQAHPSTHQPPYYYYHPSPLAHTPLHGSTSSLSSPRSILSIENQRALALQGFYGDDLPEALQEHNNNEVSTRL